MPQREVNEAELAFFGALQHGGMDKESAELAPETTEALGIPSVSPSTLDQLEEQATQLHSSTAEETVEEAPAQAPEEPAPATELEGYSRADVPPEEEVVPEPELPSRTTHGKLFSDKRANPLQILDILTRRYKTDWVKWEPETLWWALRRDFGPVGDVTRNKIGALRVAVGTDIPWLDWDVFEDSGLAWNDIVPVIGTFQPMTPMQTAFAVNVLRTIRPDEEFSHEVRAYISAILDDHGFVYAPEEMFGNVQELLDRKVWLEGFRSDVESAWEKIQDHDPETIAWNGENPLDIHLLKLSVVKRYLAEREALREVVPGVPHAPSTVSPPVP